MTNNNEVEFYRDDDSTTMEGSLMSIAKSSNEGNTASTEVSYGLGNKKKDRNIIISAPKDVILVATSINMGCLWSHQSKTHFSTDNVGTAMSKVLKLL